MANSMKRSMAIYAASTVLLALTSHANAEISSAEATTILNNNNLFANGFRWPVSGMLGSVVHKGHTSDPLNSNDGYGYGDCWNGYSNDCKSPTSIHPGIDINTASDCGKEVRAAADGVVRFAGDGGSFWGGLIMLQHRVNDPNYFVGQHMTQAVTLYGHIAPVASINERDVVYQGQLIAYLANGTDCRGTVFANPVKTKTGGWTVPWLTHLHFETRTVTSPDATHWTTMATYESQARNTCKTVGNSHPLKFRDDFTCRQIALSSGGYAEPFTFMNARKETIFDAATDHQINVCISKFSMYFGARVGAPINNGIWRMQQVRGASAGGPTWVAYSSTYPNTISYLWGQWQALNYSACIN